MGTDTENKTSLRTLQLCELEILRDVKRVCEEHGIVFYLNSGTLLGAIRHHGFIPWDDDIDIAMPINDYNRFLLIAQEALGDAYFVQNSNTDRDYSPAFTKIRKNNTTMISSWELGNPGHHGVWIDVFPLVYTGKGFDFSLKKHLLTISNILSMSDHAFSSSKKWLTTNNGRVKVLLASIGRRLPSPLRRSLCAAIRRFILNGPKKPYISTVWGNITKQYPVRIIDGPAVDVFFEGEVFPACIGWDEYLTITYGDYMTPPPEDQRFGGHGDVIIDLNHGWEEYSRQAN